MFTTPCFIRKNTPELRRKLKELGYVLCECFKIASDPTTILCTTDGRMHLVNSIHFIEGSKNSIDCGTNEDLFLAIAALRDDTDKGQFFIHESGEFILCNQSDIKHVLDNYYEDYAVSECHKATVVELIEHFKGE